MKYTIFQVDDSRSAYVKNIETQLDEAGWERQQTRCVDGRVESELAEAMARHDYRINYLPEYGEPKVGQLGIWYSVLNSFEIAPHVTFEDDAILNPHFLYEWETRFKAMPKDTDFFSLFLPRDSDHMYMPQHAVNRHVSRTYQRYGGVSMYYTERGVEKILDLLTRDGITGQYDDTLYRYSKSGELNGYCSKPILSDLVYISGNEDSIVQETGLYAG